MAVEEYHFRKYKIGQTLPLNKTNIKFSVQSTSTVPRYALAYLFYT